MRRDVAGDVRVDGKLETYAPRGLLETALVYARRRELERDVRILAATAITGLERDLRGLRMRAIVARAREAQAGQ